MTCLDCGATLTTMLVQIKRNALTYDVCEACGGLWLDAREFNRMAFQVDGSLEVCSTEPATAQREHARDCPRCKGVQLEKVRFLGVTSIILDRCPNCAGFWLEGGELAQINKELEELMPVKGPGFSEFLTNTHLPHFYKVVKRQPSTDQPAEVPSIQHATLKGDSSCRCPACGSGLKIYELYKITIEGCPQCGGTWFDKDELRRLKDKVDRGSWGNLRWMDDDVEAIESVSATLSRRMCPKCPASRLLSTKFGASRVILDWCPACHGLWLDRQEFSDIVKHLRAKLDTLPSTEMAKALYKEVKEIWSGPESLVSEILDVKAASSALINLTIYEHPRLFSALMGFPRF